MWYRPKILAILALINPTIISAQDTTQFDLIDLGLKWFKKEGPREEVKTSGKVRFSIMPTTNGTSGRLSISAMNLAFYTADPDSTNISSVFFYPYTNFSGRYSFVVNCNIWSFKNRYNLLTDVRVSSSEIEDHGLGSGTAQDQYALLQYKNFRTRILLNRLLARYLYAGVGFYYDLYQKINAVPQGDFVSDFESYAYGTGDTYTSSGLVLNLLRDSRKNSINPANGFYSNLSFQIYHPVFGSTYAWQGGLLDARKYFRLHPTKWRILALKLLYWGTHGESPYPDLPASFTDRESRMGRGYYYARFRGPQFLYGEAEFRFDLSRNGLWGAVLFTNLQSCSSANNRRLYGVDPGAGVGLRIKFNKLSNTNLTLDFGIGKDSYTFHVNLGEFF